MNPAPVALFVHNRPAHTERTLRALRANDLASETELYVFSDGPRRPEAAHAVAEVRSLLRNLAGFKRVVVRERERNMGLAENTIAGLTEVISEHGRVIMVEDDNVASPHFLRYMNDGLSVYERDEDVISILCYIYPVGAPLPETFFIRGADTWGWATWKRGWDLFERDGQKLLDEIQARGAAREFNFGGAYNFLGLLKDQIRGRNDSWSIRWYASAFLKNKLTLYPGRSLVKNIGFDATGTHCSVDTDALDVDVADRPVKVERQAIRENPEARRLMARYLRTLKLRLFWSFLKTRVKVGVPRGAPAPVASHAKVDGRE